jgi:hypothetical protein
MKRVREEAVIIEDWMRPAAIRCAQKMWATLSECNVDAELVDFALAAGVYYVDSSNTLRLSVQDQKICEHCRPYGVGNASKPEIMVTEKLPERDL